MVEIFHIVTGLLQASMSVWMQFGWILRRQVDSTSMSLGADEVDQDKSSLED
jgi:hypothetical protein